MDLEEIKKNIAEFNESEMARIRDNAEREPDEPTSGPTDLYQQSRKARREENKKFRPNGAAKIVAATARAVIDGAGAEGLARAYRRAKSDSDSLYARGEYERMKLAWNTYKDEYFLPAVELVANAASPDELLNSEQALVMLDEYAPVSGSGKGYTAAYIKRAYANQLGKREGFSDSSIQDGVRRLNAMLDAGELRMALSLAKELKRKIDKGEAMADDTDYDLIGRVVAFYA